MLLHIISDSALASAREVGEIAPESLQAEGFVHCSYPDQVLTPANERYAGQEDLLLIVLAADRIPHPLVVEDSYGSGTAYPHVYGPIPTAAIDREVRFPCRPDGTFELPDLS